MNTPFHTATSKAQRADSGRNVSMQYSLYKYFYHSDHLGSTSNVTDANDKDDPTYKPKIIGTGGYSYETTVENIASSVIVYEWYSHGKKYNSDEYKSHRLA